MAHLVSKPAILAATGAAVLAGVGLYTWQVSRRPSGLEIFFFNTKGAPAILVRTPDDRRLLIDGGANADIIRQISRVLPFYSRRVDELMLTTTDTKHVGGLIEVAKRYEVSRVYEPLSEGTSVMTPDDLPSMDFFQALLRKQKISPIKLVREQEIIPGHGLVSGEVTDVSVEILFPRPVGEFAYSTASPPQIVWRLRYGQTSLVFLGGASSKVQKSLVPDLIPTDILVISRNPASGNLVPAVLTATAPTDIVFSRSPSITGSSRSSKTAVPDPLAGFMPDRQFNIQTTEIIHIVSDGRQIKINKNP